MKYKLIFILAILFGIRNFHILAQVDYMRGFRLLEKHARWHGYRRSFQSRF